MLKLKNIQKNYVVGDTKVEALKGIDINFRKNEFVSILGPSGCGKTTLLNIVGGLDRYDEGDLAINGKSTKEFKDYEWDSYRNHSVGFVFQSYNLIPHQSVLSNVELALTLSGVSKSERRKRAAEALEKVGLGDQLKKKPNQMSGGQMQRVAIARALVNDPDILLADEPTGALDTQTSVQIMEILKEISKDRLIIMVTHNPDIAQTYSTRLIKLLDGNMVSDSNPYDSDEEKTEVTPAKTKRTTMSFITALSLSLNNLMTKKTRTFLTAFAGSIGIIGIALILALSSGIQNYIDRVQEDTLTSYPIAIESETLDISSVIASMTDAQEENSSESTDHELDKIYTRSMMMNTMTSVMSIETSKNDLTKFKKFIESEESGMSEYVSAVKYGYGNTLNIYTPDTSDGIEQVNPSTVFSGLRGGFESAASSAGGQSSMMSSMLMPGGNIINTWEEMISGRDGEAVNELLKNQYEVIAGKWPESYNEIVLITNEKNQVADMYLYSLGLKDSSEITEVMDAIMNDEEYEIKKETWSYDEILNLTYKLLLTTDFYQYDSESGTYTDMSDNETYMAYIVSQGIDLKVCGIIRPHEDAVAAPLTGVVGYTHLLTEYVADAIAKSDIVKAQKEHADIDVFNALPFDDGSLEAMTDADKAEQITSHFESLTNVEKAAVYAELALIPSEAEVAQMMEQYMMMYPDRASKEVVLTQAYAEAAGMDESAISSYLEAMSDEEIDGAMATMMREMVSSSYAEQMSAAVGAMTADEMAAAFDMMLPMLDEAMLASLHADYMPQTVSKATYDENISKLGVIDLDTPSTINIYAASFSDKDNISQIIADYNAGSDTQDQIKYTDYVALIMSSITTIINAISYVLIAFVAISLVVSSIMIGIITYISVLERTKEIGILRSIGASKGDISTVFNAETLIVGFISGAFGIVTTLVLCIPINAIIQAVTDISTLGAALPPAGGAILIAISMFLTFIAGLIPSNIAAKKDPVEALRSE